MCGRHVKQGQNLIGVNCLHNFQNLPNSVTVMMDLNSDKLRYFSKIIHLAFILSKKPNEVSQNLFVTLCHDQIIDE